MAKKLYLWILFVFLAGTLLIGCSEKKAGIQPPVSVEVVKVATADMTQSIDVVGSLSPKFQADVKTEYPGVITQIYVAEWVRVQKGTPLAQLDTRELELVIQRSEAAAEVSRANVVQAEVAQNRTEREHARFLKLKEAGLVTQQNLEDAATEKEAAAARVSAAKAQLRAAQGELHQTQTRLAKAVIRSPLDGVVSQRSMNVGDLTGDKMIFHIVDNRLLDLTVTVPSGETGSVKVGQPLLFSTDSLPGKTFTGKVAFINPAISEADRSVKIIAEVKNEPETLKAGLFVKGKIITGSRTGVLQVPRTGLVTWDVAKKQAELFIVNGDKVQRKTIITGALSGEQVEVSSGLAAGELIVTRGGFNLKDGNTVKVIAGSGR
jgi:membrane fusion protein (multidrug efflux system)